MPNIRNIRLLQCDLILHDYLFFATSQHGHTTETGQFIHNYSLTYALGWAKSEWHVETQEPQYAKKLSNVKGIYTTPASLLAGNYALMPFSEETENYTLSKTAAKSKCHRIIKCLIPGSVFRFYVITKLAFDNIPSFIRLGKFMAKAKIIKQYPEELEIAEGDCSATSLLNWDDMATMPLLCNVIVCVLSSRLIENARFARALYLRAKFAHEAEVKLPLEMGYLHRELCSSW